MRRLRILDLFCGAGGASRGYSLAGFDVYGVDHVAQPRYPYPYHQGDAIDVLRRLLAGECIAFEKNGHLESLRLSDFDAIHASPPCHDHSDLRFIHGLDGTLNLLPDTLELLELVGLPWVVENVDSADMAGIVLCGSMFLLGALTPDRGVARLRRHRRFASSHPIAAPAHPKHPRGEQTIGVYGTGDGGQGRGWKGSFTDRKAAMGIDWMNRYELSQSIPPAYTEFIGDQLYAMILETRA